GVTAKLVDAFSDRIRHLTRAARLALVTAAAADPADAPCLPEALRLLGVTLVPTGLVQVGHTIQFRHPLVRMAALACASAAERRRVEAALGSVVVDRERRAWHRVNAAVDTDDGLAAELARLAVAAGTRLAYAAQCQLLVAAARLVSSSDVRARYLV